MELFSIRPYCKERRWTREDIRVGKERVAGRTDDLHRDGRRIVIDLERQPDQHREAADHGQEHRMPPPGGQRGWAGRHRRHMGLIAPIRTPSGSVIQGMLRPWSGCQGRYIARLLEIAVAKGRTTPQAYLQAQKVTPIRTPKLVSPWLGTARFAFDKWSNMTDRL